jgi:hypothetical protein
MKFMKMPQLSFGSVRKRFDAVCAVCAEMRIGQRVGACASVRVETCRTQYTLLNICQRKCVDGA